MVKHVHGKGRADGLTPQRIRCKNCYAIIYEGEELKPPYEIIQRYEGRCPECRGKLSRVPKNVEVKPIN